MMLCTDLRSCRLAREHSGPVFFDRGLPDVLGYLRLEGLPVPPHLVPAVRAFHYNQRVFIAPPWVEIFAQDTERRQDFAEAVLTFEIMKETYSAYGYDLIELPRLPIPERVAFVLARMRSHGAGPHHSTVTDLARLRG